ncbi:FAD-binding dehydrogenase [Ectopseudomonas toyotomiensis]|uniref:Succinate dehydrogenase/fumarate reductase, flavoprotein subunit n=1 Tax=Ectopseudomonas toyotomiensis TaxID=554344 RepID=A0A1I5YAY4_9GAMM|nr:MULTISPECIES: FAD-dependent oxidoreductase [Pseudomonas]PIA68655.1 FAD-binding dehydrogenase [Pseudomonas toyotomiensis]SDA81926.1 Succinate dehydrogenase/fumarate reductase, flavoprotein subunit [Pseudomonas sp. NFPP33]SFQ41381.1 Succinate dehydrogenase/fumarate reductase, flavoprotein subunit [Pseudomonas toyotomiensis]
MANAPLDCDLLVVGSGAAGLAAAVSAAHLGKRVILVEKDAVLGGATAWSGGWLWAPRNPLAQRAGIVEDIEQPRTYLRNELGEHYRPELVDAFLQHCPDMVAFFEQHTALQFVDGNGIPDMHGDTPGAASGGHQVIAAPYDGREVLDLLPHLRKTMRETSFMGMPIMAGADLAAFLNMTRSPRALLYVIRRFTTHLYHLARYGRAMHLVNGVALVARLARSAQDLGVQMMVSTPAQRLIIEDGNICGAVVLHAGEETTIRAKAVVLAAGGFPNDPERRKAIFPRDASGHDNLALPPASCSGDGLRLGESAGGYVADDLRSPVAWAPVSKVPYADGSVGHFPHIIDRGKPGIIGVLQNGKRFVNEAGGYYDYVDAMLKAIPEDQQACSWLICDHRFQRRYGLGFARPAPVPLWPHIRNGYLKRGHSLEALAQACGIDPFGLVATVDEFNQHARRGEDPLFGRGSTAFNRRSGDAQHNGPNPCVAPIEHGPFYAVKVQPGCFGTFAGLRTDGHARVLDGVGQPIPGLYAAGTDMASPLGGHYPSGGINIGPALTFGYIAGRHAAAV